MALSSAVPNLLNSGTAVYFGTAVPAAADAYGLNFNVGDMVINTAPTAGSTIGWMCTAAGSPGTWQALSPGTVDATYSMLANASLATQPFFNNGTQTYKAIGAFESHETAGTDAGTVSLDITNDATTVAAGGGSSILAAAFSLKATAKVVQTGALNATAANLLIAAGSRLSVKYTGVLTAVAGVVVKVVLVKL